MKKNIRDWLRYLISHARNQTRFVSLTPFGVSKHQLFDTKNKKKINLVVCDEIDVNLIKSIFLHEDYHLNHSRTTELKDLYQKILARNQTPLIIDCGANRGFATRYFYETFPKAHIIAIEPDKTNLELAKKNNSEGNIRFELACIGSESGFADINDPSQGHWAYRTELNPAGQTPVITIDQILEEESEKIPFIIKIDIEGFESNLFSKNTTWIDRFPLLIIELHDWMLSRSGSARAFLSEIAKRDRDFLYRGENVFSFDNSTCLQDKNGY